MKTPIQTSDIIPLSNIISGLLASGHFTYDTEFQDEEFFKRHDFGENWREDHKGHPLIYTRHVPEVLLEAVRLYRAAKDYCALSRNYE
jgi:benzoyl-CoA reductase/2-hydroxyglutaryl-CoA dehydratase subunit BcrC/BadD/HgdB